MRAVLPFLLVLLTATPAQAEALPLELWNGLRVGMSKDEVKAIRPSRKVILNASCRGRLKPVFQDDQLQAVRIFEDIDHNDCGRELYAALMRKYGVPAGQGSVGYLGLTGFGTTYDFYWYSEGRAIRLRLLKSGRFSELSYTPDLGDMDQI